FFFFSSRRRHTRFSRDWSSDVCSSVCYRSRHISQRRIYKINKVLSDLASRLPGSAVWLFGYSFCQEFLDGDKRQVKGFRHGLIRSEERRVGKECRGRWAVAEG